MTITCYLYKIPFQNPFKTGKNIYKYREGIILELKKEGITAYGEAAPLPGFSSYSLNEVLTQLKEFQSEFKQLFQNRNPREVAVDFYHKNTIKPSLQFALDTLITDWMSQKHGQSLADFLFENHNNYININGVVGSSAGIIEMLDKSAVFDQPRFYDYSEI
ncbi:MAG: hypothetical protein U5J95_00665 [Balneolaceae bacterium]|nr:hypothetical protein [Balneolaceae bacterium]